MEGSSQSRPFPTKPDQSHVRTATEISDHSQSGRQHSDIVSVVLFKRLRLGVGPNGVSRHSSIRGQCLTEELKTAVAAKERDIADTINSTDQQLSTLEGYFKQLNPTGIERGNASCTEDTGKDEAGMRRTIEEERAMLHILLGLLRGLETRTQEEAKKMAEEEQKQTTKVAFGSNNSGFQLGVNSGTISGFTFGGRGP